MRDDGLRGIYHLHELQAAYNSNFSPENSVLSAVNSNHKCNTFGDEGLS
jgi:hypothetical protein